MHIEHLNDTFNADNDQSGLALYTCDGTKIFAIYGEDPSTAVAASPSIDVGTTIQPLCLKAQIFANDDLAYGITDVSVDIPVLYVQRWRHGVSEMYKVFHELLPPNNVKMFQKADIVKLLNTRETHQLNFHQSKLKSELSRNNFIYGGTQIWKEILEVKLLASWNVFKKRITSFFP